jgi:NAD-dependent deacetylase
MSSELASLIRASRACVVLTGAGVSTASGIPDFRSDHGLWAHEDVGRVASIGGFRSDPRGFYDFWVGKLRVLEGARPNDAHRVLAKLEARGLVHGIVTQNVDGLHQDAGAREVMEVHGTFRTARCLGCGARYETRKFLAELRPGEEPSCAICSGLVKPDVVLFGEALDPSFERASSLVRGCDLLISMGTSLEVAPVSGLVPLAVGHGAKLVIVNRDVTAYDDDAALVLGGDLVQRMRALAHELAIAI